jgi:hypothetical protein
MFMAVTTQDGADRLADLLTPLLQSHHLMLLVSNVEIIRGGRFD